MKLHSRKKIPKTRNQDLLKKSQPCLESMRSLVWNYTRHDYVHVPRSLVIAQRLRMHKPWSFPSLCSNLLAVSLPVEKGCLFVPGIQQNGVGRTNWTLVYIAFLKNVMLWPRTFRSRKPSTWLFRLQFPKKCFGIHSSSESGHWEVA